MTRRHPLRRAARGTAGERTATRPAAACACLLLAALLTAPDTALGRGRKEAVSPESLFTNDQANGHAPFSGTVTDAGGAPLSEVAVAMCASACWPTTTDAAGQFSFPSLPIERYVLDVRGESVAGRVLTSVVLPVELPAGGRELPPVQLHDATALQWHGTAPVRIAGLSLVPAGPVDLGALRRAAGTGGGDAPATIGGAPVPRAAWPEYELAAHDAHYRPLAMWALYPFGARLGGRLALQAARPTELGAGQEEDLAFFSVDQVTGTAEWLGPAHSEQDHLHSGPDAGITTLTWVILAVRSR